ncbi:cation diffusion facilitator family transporter [Alterileibacterium massiliense]|uniref:cation diffusion facilitator family transporter n=1 Tax=Alterileibacterium massiliense TaxID=1870997 RepID=UPI0008DB2CAC|nr:cation diffusion facilitator family transporter [Alterileibacterium massiliense]
MNNKKIDDNYEQKMIKQVSAVGIFGNVLLVIFKLFAGIIGNSAAMVSDAIHSASDVVATLVAFIGVRASKKEADSKHPYGHERIECVASLILGSILFMTGIGIGIASVKKIILGQSDGIESPKEIALIAAIISIVTKEVMFRYTRAVAKKLNSDAFMADAWHHRSDAFSSIGSLIGIGAAMLGFKIMDPIAGLIICIFIFKIAFDVIMVAISKMLDTSCGKEYEDKMTNFISAQEGVIGVDLLRTRTFGNKIYVDAEISVDGNLRLREAHSIAERVHNEVENNFDNIKHIMIHVNPR